MKRVVFSILCIFLLTSCNELCKQGYRYKNSLQKLETRLKDVSIDSLKTECTVLNKSNLKLLANAEDFANYAANEVFSEIRMYCAYYTTDFICHPNGHCTHHRRCAQWQTRTEYYNGYNDARELSHDLHFAKDHLSLACDYSDTDNTLKALSESYHTYRKLSGSIHNNIEEVLRLAGCRPSDDPDLQDGNNNLD